jgi:hypothetical protein
MRETADKVRELIRWAKLGGAETTWLNGVSADLAKLLLEVQDLRRAVDPRKLETLDLARRVAKADATLRKAGCKAGRTKLLATRFSLSKDRINVLLRMDCDSQSTSVVHSADEHESI